MLILIMYGMPHATDAMTANKWCTLILVTIKEHYLDCHLTICHLFSAIWKPIGPILETSMSTHTHAKAFNINSQIFTQESCMRWAINCVFRYQLLHRYKKALSKHIKDSCFISFKLMSHLTPKRRNYLMNNPLWINNTDFFMCRL